MQVRWHRTRPSDQPIEDQLVNVMHLDFTGTPPTAAALDAVGTDWMNWSTALRTYLSGNFSVQEIRYYELPATPGPAGDPIHVQTGTLVGVGGSAADLPPQVAATVTFQTAQRRHWGRIYIPGLAVPAVQAGRIIGDCCDQLGNKFASFVTNRKNANEGVLIFNRKLWTGLGVSAVSVDDIWDVQRRRRYATPLHRFQSPPL